MFAIPHRSNYKYQGHTSTMFIMAETDEMLKGQAPLGKDIILFKKLVLEHDSIPSLIFFARATLQRAGTCLQNLAEASTEGYQMLNLKPGQPSAISWLTLPTEDRHVGD
jgi:hypothetical protein